MKKPQDKNSSITSMTILFAVVLSIIFLICAPHLSSAQSASNDKIDMPASGASSILAASYSLADLAGECGHIGIRTRRSLLVQRKDYGCS